ncbi:MAG TPA: serine/threonine-protein kinase [Kofleriaceae bacterium]
MQTAAVDESLIGVVLEDKYRIVRIIGQGGMGVVFEAEHINFGKRVAVKVMLEKYALDTEAIARFHREALAASRIGNQHIIDIHDMGQTPDGRMFVAMELLDGAPLSKILEASGPMPPWRAIHIMRQVLRAVGAAHAKGIIHRDLKPDNIFLVNEDDHHDFVKLLDFGISKVVDLNEQVAATKLTTTGVVIGTPLYMAPEQAMGNPIDGGADVYACGVMLYELLAGKPPFEGATYAVLVAKLLTSPPTPLEQLRPGLPPELVRAVHRALEKDPKRRYTTAEQFSAALPGRSSGPYAGVSVPEPVSLSQIQLGGTLDSTMGATARKARTRTRVVMASLSALVLAAVTAFVIVSMRDQETPAASVVPTTKEIAEPVAAVTTGTLEIKSTPLGAAVKIDGAPSGTTPIIVTLTPGKHRIYLELEGHVAIESDEEVRVGERTSVVIPLQQLADPAPPGPPPAPIVELKSKPGRPSKGSKSSPRMQLGPPGPTAPAGDAATVKPETKAEEPSRAEPVKTSKPPPPPGTKPNPY